MKQPPGNPSVIWLHTGRLDQDLDAATWLDTTFELRKLGWRVTLITAGPWGPRSIHGTEVFCIPMPDLSLLRLLVYHVEFYLLLLKRPRPDVILFGQMSAPWLLPVRIIRSLFRSHRPLLALDIRSLHMELSGRQSLKARLRGKYQDEISRTARTWIDGYTVITSRMAHHLGISRDQLWGVWPSGVDFELFQHARTSHSWPTQQEPVRLVYIGALHFERNLMTFCRAVEQANADGMSFELWLVGNGNERRDLEKYAAQTQGRIVVKQPVPHCDIPSILGQAHVGVLPFPDEAKFQVSSPIKLFEYMAAGLPILATRIACHTDVIGEGAYVFWAARADEAGLLEALGRIWRDRGAMPGMGVQAAAAAQACTWHASAVKLKESLERGLARISS